MSGLKPPTYKTKDPAFRRGEMDSLRLNVSIFFACYIDLMFSIRFNLPVVLTLHAQKRLRDRSVSLEELMLVIDTGETRFKDPIHLWAFKNLPGRTDNLVCAVLVLEDAVVVKTVMHEFVLED
jgi:hypothetical protein